MKSVFHLFYRPRYYFKHPLRFIKEIISNIRDVIHRARYGWTYSDVWNFNSWFLEIIPDMLDYLSEHGYGYPGDEEFPTYESWQKWLKDQAAAIRSCSEEGQESRNEYKAEYDAALEQCRMVTKPDPDHPNLRTITFENEPANMDEITKKYYARASEIAVESEATLIKAMTELATKMPTLWD